MKKILVFVFSILFIAAGAADFVNPNQVADRKFSPELAGKLRIRQAWTTNDTHGDIYIINTPDGKITLLDCGWGDRGDKSKKYYNLVLFPALAEQNIKKIDRVIITHPHPDHIGGLPFLLRKKEIEVKEVCWAYIEPELLKKYKNPSAISYQDAVIRLCKERNIPIRDIKTGDSIDLGGGAVAQILTIGYRKANGSNWLNNQSLVFKLQYGSFSILFTGDCGFEEENDLIRTYGDKLRCDVLKLGHHGGAGSTSEKFLKTVAPKAAIAPIPDWLAVDPRGKRVTELVKKHNIPYFMSWQYPLLSVVSDGKTFEMINIVY